jgi:hypothetical protein
MPAHHIAQANRQKLGISGMEKIVAFDQTHHWMISWELPEANNVGTPSGNGLLTFAGNIRKEA